MPRKSIYSILNIVKSKKPLNKIRLFWNNETIISVRYIFFRQTYFRDQMKPKTLKQKVIANLLKVKKRSTRTMSEIGLKLTIKHQNDVNNVVLVTLLVPLNRFHTLLWCFYYWLWTNFTHCSGVSIIDFEQVNASWVFRFIYILSRIVKKLLHLLQNTC